MGPVGAAIGAGIGAGGKVAFSVIDGAGAGMGISAKLAYEKWMKIKPEYQIRHLREKIPH